MKQVGWVAETAGCCKLTSCCRLALVMMENTLFTISVAVLLLQQAASTASSMHSRAVQVALNIRGRKWTIWPSFHVGLMRLTFRCNQQATLKSKWIFEQCISQSGSMCRTPTRLCLCSLWKAGTSNVSLTYLLGEFDFNVPSVCWQKTCSLLVKSNQFRWCLCKCSSEGTTWRLEAQSSSFSMNRSFPEQCSSISTAFFFFFFPFPILLFERIGLFTSDSSVMCEACCFMLALRDKLLKLLKDYGYSHK